MTDDLLRATVSIRSVAHAPDGRILIMKRASDGEWELPGGRLGRDERSIEGLRRELREETDISIKIGGPIHSHAWQNGDCQDRFAVFYRARAFERSVTLSPEHTDYEWAHSKTARPRLQKGGDAAVQRADQIPGRNSLDLPEAS